METYAIHYALQKLNHYLHGAEFVIYSDHKPPEYLSNSPMQNRKIQLWALSITGYNCKIQYLKGTRNVCTDLLSRSKGTWSTSQDREVDIDDRAYEVSAINSNRFEARRFAKLNEESRADEFEMPPLVDFDMVYVSKTTIRRLGSSRKDSRGRRQIRLKRKKFIILD